MHTLRLILMFIFCSSPLLAADIHKWVDKDGNVHFGDKPSEQIESTSITVKPNGSGEPLKQKSSSSLADYDAKPKVIMYGTSWCGYCKKARDYFNERGIAFTEYDIEKSKEAKREYDALNGKGIPVILVGNKLLNGYSLSSLNAMFK